MKKIFDVLPPKRLERKEVVPLVEKKRFRFGWLFLIFFIFGLTIFFLNQFSFAKIEIWPKIEVQKFEFDLLVDREVKNPDLLKMAIPGQEIEREGTISRDFPSSGKLMKEKKAEGKVRIYNNYHLSQTLVANTRIQPPLEKFKTPLEEPEKPWFLTTEKIVIPPGDYRDVNVIAHSPGEKYNIEPSEFSIPGLRGTPQYTLIYGRSFEPMKGGAKKEVLVVSDDDLKKAKDSLSEMVKEEGEKLLRENATSGFLFLAGVSKTEIIETTFSAKAGDELEKFNCQMKIKAKALIVFKKEFDDLIENYILEKIQNKKIKEGSLMTNYSINNFNIDLGKALLSINAQVKTYSEPEEVSFKKTIAKKELNEIRAFLKNQPEIERSEIKIFPFWLKNLPENFERIKLELKLD